jgi:steroid delta-isomerase-like uncharacterized protein
MDRAPVLSNKQVMRRWFERVWNHRDERAIHELMASGHVGHGLIAGEPLVGPDAFVPYFRRFAAAMPDVQIAIEDLIEEDDRVCARWTATGTLTGDDLGVAPTGNRATVSGMSIGRIVDGQIVESWNVFDQLHMHRQFGTLAQLAGG